MTKTVGKHLVLALLFLSLAGETAFGQGASETNDQQCKEASGPALQITDGAFFVEGQRIEWSRFDLRLDPFKFLSFYLKEQGQIIVSPAPFPEAEPRGKFEEDKLSFEVEGRNFRLVSEEPLLARGAGSSKAWVRRDSIGVGNSFFSWKRNDEHFGCTTLRK
jgi:hypothetical protein